MGAPGRGGKGAGAHRQEDVGEGTLVEATSWGLLCSPLRQERWHGGKRWEGWQEQGDPIRARKLALGQCQRGTFTSTERECWREGN